jgi:3-oxoacyl-[acyl-carrier protein] reductase
LVLGLTSKVAVATGVGRGIGRAVAEELVASGFKVVIWTRGPQDLHRAVEQPRQHSFHQARIHSKHRGPTDERTAAAIEEATAQFGGADILVNNAGSQRGHLSFDQLSDEN